jgi:hypothetical protein
MRNIIYVAAAFTPAFMLATTRTEAQEPWQPTCATVIDSLARIARPTIDDSLNVTLPWRAAFCDDFGPAQIARLWALPDLTDREYTNLGWLSAIADVRLSDTLTLVARRTTLRAHARTWALYALSHHVNRDTPPTLPFFVELGVDNNAGGYFSHSGSSPGGRPLTDTDRQRVIKVFADLSTQTAVPTVQHAARAALRLSAGNYPTLTPVPNGTVTLTYICGNRFRVRNRSSVWGSFRYDVYGTNERRDVSVPVSVSPTVASEVFFTTANTGTVRLFWKGQLLQTKANGGTVCSTSPP